MSSVYSLTTGTSEGKEGEEGRVEAQEERGVGEAVRAEIPRTLSGLLKEGLRLPTYSIPWETYTTAFETIKRMNQEEGRKKR
jgi:hypothetical protein